MLPDHTTTIRRRLPQAGERCVSDAGLETELVFKDGLDLPAFSSAVLLETAAGRDRLRRYYAGFVALAERSGCGLVLETPTWRNNRDWAEGLGYDRQARSRINHAAVHLLQDLRHASWAGAGCFVISGNLGPRFDGYQGDRVMQPEDAAAYHREQIEDLAAAGADSIGAMTITTSAEACGIAAACRTVAIPAVISFTLETDGRLPSGELLGEAIARVDRYAPDAVAYFGINCAHPTHFIDRIRSREGWTRRLGAIRANASTKSHAELDASTSLDEGDREALAAHYRELQELLPQLRVMGGCCGTDIEHVSRICATCAC